MIRQPTSVIIAGPSGSGKSDLVENLLREKKLFYPPPQKMVYCYDRWQPRFDRMKKHSKVIFYKGLPPEGALVKWFKPEHHGILILDDLMEESGNDKRVLELFTKSSSCYYRVVSNPRSLSSRQICQNHQPQRALCYLLQKSSGQDGHP